LDKLGLDDPKMPEVSLAKTSSSRKRWASMTFPGILCRMIHWLSVLLRLAVAGLNSCRNLLFGKPGFAPPTGAPEPGMRRIF
jgi:hypothetical protein